MSFKHLKGASVPALIAVVVATAACERNHNSGDNGSRLLDLQVSNSSAIAAVKDSASARDAAQSQGFLGSDACSGGIKGGEVVMFSTTLALNSENGQASGVLTKQDGGYFFDEKAQFIDNQNQLLAPGVTGNPGAAFSEMMSSWEFTGYLGLICQVAFDLNSSAPTPLYTTASAAIVDINGGTAGLQASYKGVMEIRLDRTTDFGSHSTLNLYLKKGFGPVALEYIESNTYNPIAYYAGSDGAFRLYVNDNGGNAVGNGPSATIAQQAQMKACTDAKGQWYGDYTAGQCISADQIAAIAKATKDCTDGGGDWQGDWASGSCLTAAMKAVIAKCQAVGGYPQNGSCYIKTTTITTQDACNTANGMWWQTNGTQPDCWTVQDPSAVASATATATATATASATSTSTSTSP